MDLRAGSLCREQYDSLGCHLSVVQCPQHPVNLLLFLVHPHCSLHPPQAHWAQGWAHCAPLQFGPTNLIVPEGPLPFVTQELFLLLAK